MTFKTTEEIQDFDWNYAHKFKTINDFFNQQWISKEELYQILEEELLQNDSAFLIHLKERFEKKN